MITVQKVTGTDGEDFDYMDMATWKEMVGMGAFTPDDGHGYPAIKSQTAGLFEVRGHSVWHLQDGWDGVVWYNK